VKRLFHADNLIGTHLGDPDFFYAVADGAAMMDQYGAKSRLCAGLAKLPSSPSDMDRLSNLESIISQHYGQNFAAGCFYDSECLQKDKVSIKGNGLGGFNDRSWRWQKCSEIAFLQPAPSKGTPMRSANLTLNALLHQCDYVFGDGTAAAMQSRNKEFNAKFGGAKPTSGAYPNSSNIFYLDFSDDPWEEASVSEAQGPTLNYCMTTCNGCGHCGAGVPFTQHQCTDKSKQFVAGVLEAGKQLLV